MWILWIWRRQWISAFYQPWLQRTLLQVNPSPFRQGIHYSDHGTAAALRAEKSVNVKLKLTTLGSTHTRRNRRSAEARLQLVIDDGCDPNWSRDTKRGHVFGNELPVSSTDWAVGVVSHDIAHGMCHVACVMWHMAPVLHDIARQAFLSMSGPF